MFLEYRECVFFLLFYLFDILALSFRRSEQDPNILIKTYVDVEPDAVLFTDVGNGLNGVKGSEDGGAGGAVDEEGKVTLALVTDNQLLQLFRDHAAAEIKFDNYFFLSFEFPPHERSKQGDGKF